MSTMFLIFVLQVISFEFPTIYDPLAARTDAAEDLKNNTSFFSNHEQQVKVDTFGDLSIMTLNVYSQFFKFTDEEIIAGVIDLIDRSHVKFFCLQGVDKELLKNMKKNVTDNKKHYGLAAIGDSSTDLENSKNYYLPIVYDKKAATLKKDGYYKTKNELSFLYASYAIFKYKNDNILVINIDLSSSFKNITVSEFANILGDIITDSNINDYTILMAGNIIVIPESIKKFISEGSFKNLVKEDVNNKELPKTTLHMEHKNNDNIQRNFILLRDTRSVYFPNYARILSGFNKVGDYYPIHAILTKKNVNINEAKNKTETQNDAAIISEAYKRQDTNEMRGALQKASKL